MKKGLLLSIVASTVIFAGGDIAPVEPAAAAPAADCSDFYGQVGVYYQSEAKGDDSVFSDEATNNLSATVVLGVEKEIFNGIGFGAQLNGWSTLGLAPGGTLNEDGDGHIDGARVNDDEGAALVEMYATASFGNTGIKLGRFALPIALSPYAWTDNTGGVKDKTFEGVMFANTDLADTTVYGVYVKNMFASATNTRSALGKDDIGVFALGMVNKSVENTKITAVGFYAPDIDAVDDGAQYAGYLTVNSKVGDYKVDFQAAYVDGDRVVAGEDADAKFAVAARISGKIGMVGASLAASYVNDGGYALAPVGGAWWLYTANEVTGEELVAGTATTGVLAKVSAKVGMGTLFGTLGYWSADDAANTEMIGARIGYKFKVAGISTKIVYRYRNQTADEAEDQERQRVRIEGTYKF